jgi:nitrite reductase (NADH) small subunit
MTTTEPTLAPTAGWTAICRTDRLTPDRGVAALVDGAPVAVFLLSDGATYAIGNVDPFSGASVLSRGVVGDVGGTPTVASPIFKQRFDLRTGRSIEDASVAVPTYDVRLVDGTGELRTGDARP